VAIASSKPLTFPISRTLSPDANLMSMSFQRLSAMRHLSLPYYRAIAFRTHHHILSISTRREHGFAPTIATPKHHFEESRNLSSISLASIHSSAPNVSHQIARPSSRIRPTVPAPSRQQSSMKTPVTQTTSTASRGSNQQMYATLRALHPQSSQTLLFSPWLRSTFAVARPLAW
jgi:hypothetical protein